MKMYSSNLKSAESCLKRLGRSFRPVLAALLLFVAGSAVALAQSQITGTVLDNYGEPLAGAAVLVTNPGSTLAIDHSVTGIDGTYAVKASEGQYLTLVSWE
jgi:hypothetical protein